MRIQQQYYTVLQVCCGARHTLVKTRQGEAYAWGWNKYGQLGLGDTENRLVPCSMQKQGTVESVACGCWHSMLIVTNPEHYFRTDMQLQWSKLGLK